MSLLSDDSAPTSDAENQFHPQVIQILERIADAVVLLNPQGQILYRNSHAQQIFPLESIEADSILKSHSGELDPLHQSISLACQRVIQQQTEVRTTTYSPKLQKWFEIQIHPCEWGLSVCLRDITQHQQAIAQLQLLEQAIIASNNGIVISDMQNPQQPLIYCNPAFEQLTGYNSAEILGRNCRFLQGADTDPAMVEELRICIREQRDGMVTLKNYRKDGTFFWNELRISPVRDANGQVTHYIGVQNDITERKQAQEALRQSELRFQQLAANLPGMIYQFRLTSEGAMSFVYVSPGCREVYEVEQEALLENTQLILNQIHPDDQLRFNTSVAHSAQTLEPWSWEGRFITPSGKLKWIQGISRPERQANGDTLWDGLLIDISDRKFAEELLRKSEANLIEAQSVAHIGSWELDIITQELSWSEELFRIFGLDPKQPIPSYADRLQHIHPGDRQQWLRTTEKARLSGIPYELDFRIFRPDGSIRYVHAKGQPTTNADGEVTRLFGTILDITELKQTEAALRQHIQMLDFANDTIMILGLDSTIHYWNHGAEKLYGWTKQEALGKNAHQLLKTVWPDSLEAAYSVCLRRGYWEGELVHSRWDGQQIVVASRWTLQRDENGEPTAILEINNNISDRKQAENALRESEQREREKALQLEETLRQLQRTQARLVQYEKMVSLGQLVAGVAHEINNPISFIHSNLNYANSYAQDLLNLLRLYQQHHPNPAPEIQVIEDEIELNFIATDFPKLLHSMKTGTERIRQIVLSLRNFSRLDEAELKSVDIHQGIESTLDILQHRLKAQNNHPEIEVIREYANLPKVQCYPGQLNQVFMNLLINSLDALEQGVGSRVLHSREGFANVDNKVVPSPTIRIRTELGQKLIATDSGNKLIDHIIIRIADNGPGFKDEIQRRLFDPFFSTKPVGKGAGLGLSICYQVIVEQHSGDIRCVSAPGLGAEFILEIPLRQTTSSLANSKFIARASQSQD